VHNATVTQRDRESMEPDGAPRRGRFCRAAPIGVRLPAWSFHGCS
jgi:hypothetical protein